MYAYMIEQMHLWFSFRCTSCLVSCWSTRLGQMPWNLASRTLTVGNQTC